MPPGMKAMMFLNSALGLKLTRAQLADFSRQYKLELAKQQGFVLDDEADIDKFETVFHFKPRKGATVKASAGKTMRAKR